MAYYHDTIRFSQQWTLNMAKSRKNDFEQDKFDEFISPDEGLFERNI